jgi:hypothetical protein
VSMCLWMRCVCVWLPGCMYLIVCEVISDLVHIPSGIHVFCERVPNLKTLFLGLIFSIIFVWLFSLDVFSPFLLSFISNKNGQTLI